MSFFLTGSGPQQASTGLQTQQAPAPQQGGQVGSNRGEIVQVTNQ